MTPTPIRATVVVPTFDHGPLLEYSVNSALAQTVQELEIFVIGDGVPDEARKVIGQLSGGDQRVRFFDNPKGPRHGEIHRHAALGEARGRMVCYLSDDDLWFPNHIETMEHLLEVTDLTHTLPVNVLPDGTIQGNVGDLALPKIRQRMLDGWNFIPLSCVGHTLDAYRRLPFGWRTTPPDTHTDLYMWQQFLAKPDCRCLSSSKLTVLHFPSPFRGDFSLADRESELSVWAARLSEIQPATVDAALDYYAREYLRHHLALGDRQARIDTLEAEQKKLNAEAEESIREMETLRHRLESEAIAASEALAERARLEDRLDHVTRQCVTYESQMRQLQGLLTELHDDLDRERHAAVSANDELRRIRATVSWRLRGKLLKAPGVRRALELRKAARGRDGDGDR